MPKMYVTFFFDKKTNDKLFGVHNVRHETTRQFKGSLFYSFILKVSFSKSKSYTFLL